MKYRIEITSTSSGYEYSHPFSGAMSVQYAPDKSYCIVETNQIISGASIATQKDILRLRTLDDRKADKKAELKAHYLELRKDLNCDSGLGFRVNSGYENLVDFQQGLALGWLTVRDYDNQNHTVTEAEMQQIIDSITAFGFAMKTNKWALESLIESATEDTIDTIDVTSGWPS